MGKTYTGIDIGAAQVKFAVCESGGEVRRTETSVIPEQLVREGRIVSPEAMSGVLRAEARRLRLRNRDCALVLPSALTLTRRLSLPFMTTEQLTLNLPYEFRDMITQEKDKYFYDYAVLGRRQEEGSDAELDLIASTVLKSTITTYAAMLRRAGFRLRVAAPAEFAYANLLRRYEQTYPDAAGREICIIDIGHSATRVHIFSGSRFEVTRVIDVGCAALDAVIADHLHVDEHIAAEYKIRNHNDVQALEGCRDIYHNIAVEIMRAVNFYGFNNPGSRLTDAFTCGGGAMIPLLLEEIGDNIGLTMHSIEEFMPPGRRDGQDAIFYPAAAGITQQ